MYESYKISFCATRCYISFSDSPMKRKSGAFLSSLLTAILLLEWIVPPSSAHALRAESTGESAGLEELKRDLRKLAQSAGFLPAPSTPIAAGLEEQPEPDEEALLEYLNQYLSQSRIRYQEAGAWHSHWKNLSAAMGEKRAQSMFPLVKEYAGEIYVVPDSLIGNRGAWWSSNAETLYLGQRALEEADLSLLRVALKENAFGPLQEWAAAPAKATAEAAPAQTPVSAPAAGPAAAEPPAPVGTPAPPIEPPAPPVEPPASVGTPSPPESPPPPEPALPPSQQVTAVRAAIQKAAQDAFQGRMLPNVSGMTAKGFDETALSVWTDVTDSEAPGLSWISLGGLPAPMPLVPDPRALSERPTVQSQGRYRTDLSGNEVHYLLAERHPSRAMLNSPLGRDIEALCAGPDGPKRRWLEETVRLLRPILQSGGRDLERWRGERPEAVGKLLWAVRHLHLSQRELSERVRQTEQALRQASQRGKLPAAQVRAALHALAEVLEPWPRIQAHARVELGLLPEGEEPMDLEAVLGLIGYLPEGARQMNLLALFDQVPSEILAEAAYDAFRSVWLDRLDGAEGALGSAESPALEPWIREIFWMGQWLEVLEKEQAISDLLRDKARVLSSGEKVTDLIVPAIGALFLTSEGRPRRFVPGGGAATVSLRGTAARFFPFRLVGWFQPGDRVVLLYPSLTGLPNVEQVDFFTEDVFLLHRALHGGPEIRMGTVTPDGAVRCYQLAGGAMDPVRWTLAARQGDFTAYRRLADFFKDTIYAPYAGIVSEGEDRQELERLARSLAKGGGKRISSGGKKKLMQHFDKVTRWMAALAEKLPSIIQLAAGKVYGPEEAAAVAADVEAYFAKELKEIGSIRRENPTRLKEALPAFAQRVQMYLAERIAAPLVAEGGLLTPVQIEGLTDPNPPTFAPPRAEPAAAAKELTEAELKAQAEPIIRELVQRSQDKAHRKVFPPERKPDVQSFAERWAMEQLRSGKVRPRFVDFKKAWEEYQRHPPPDPRVVEAERLRAEAERLKAEADAALATLPKQRLETGKDVKRAEEVVTLLEQASAFLEPVEGFEQEARRFRSELSRLHAAMEQARRRMEREARDAARDRNDRILERSRLAGEVARTLLADDRFGQFISRQEEIQRILRKISEGDRPAGLAKALQAQLAGQDIRKMGEFERRFREALLRLAGLVLSQEGQAGLEEGMGRLMDHVRRPRDQWDVNYLRENLSSQNGRLREASAWFLSRLRQRAFPALQQALSDNLHWESRQAAAWALGWMDRSVAQRKPELLELLKQLRRDDSVQDVRKAARWAFQQIHPKGRKRSSRGDSAGLEESPAIAAYREGVDRVKAEMARLGVQTPLSPGEVWTLAHLAGPEGHVALVPLDQKLGQWIPAFPRDVSDASAGLDWDVRYRMGIAARLLREVQELQRVSTWRTSHQPFLGQIGFLFSSAVTGRDQFHRLRSDEAPFDLSRHLLEGASLRDVRFLAQGERSDVPRWKAAETEVTVQEAVEVGAIGWKVHVMLPAMLPGREYHPHWGRLTEQNLRWIKERVREARVFSDGRGLGLVAGAIIWAAPPKDFVPSEDEALAGEPAKEFPADWALAKQMDAWLLSSEKEHVEASPEFALAHEEVTERVVTEWAGEPGVTLIMMAGPHFTATEEHWRDRGGQARAAMERIAAVAGGKARGKIIPLSRNRPVSVYRSEIRTMAEQGLAAGIAAGRTLLQRFVDPETGKFHPMRQHMFRQKATLAAVDLLDSLRMFRDKDASSVWQAHGIALDQASALIAAVQQKRSSAGLEEPEQFSLEDFAQRNGADLSDGMRGLLEAMQLKGANHVTTIRLTGVLPVYVQGAGLFAVVEQELPQPKGGPRLNPISLPVTQWEEIGLILEDRGLDTAVENPKGLPVRRVWAVDVPLLDPVELIGEMFRNRLGIPKSAYAGETIYTDKEGDTYLALFSA